MKFDQKSGAGLGATIAVNHRLAVRDVLHALMLSNEPTTTQLTRQGVDALVRDELATNGMSRLVRAKELIADLEPDFAQEKYDWARVQLLKSWGELHGLLPAVLAT